jgi:hypothetical protein
MRNALLLSLLLAACGTSETGTGVGDGEDWGEGLGTPENPVPTKSGPYAMVNKVDFTVEQIVPAQVELVVATLRDFSTNPAHALISIADRAGVPAASTIYDLIPGAIKGRFEGWINTEIAKAKINGKPITEYAGDVAKLFEYALTDFAVDSELTIDSTEAATHRITALDLRPTGIDFVLPIGGLAGDVLTQTPTISIAEGGSIVFGQQHFGLNYGEYAWQAIEGFTTQVFGGTIRQTLGKAMNCPAIAQTVASKCVLGICVGHATEIESVCEGGLTAIVDFVHDQIAAHRIEALHFASGGARLVDDDADGVGDRIVDGDWDAEMNFGLGLRHTNATFTGAR